MVAVNAATTGEAQVFTDAPGRRAPLAPACLPVSPPNYPLCPHGQRGIFLRVVPTRTQAEVAGVRRMMRVIREMRREIESLRKQRKHAEERKEHLVAQFLLAGEDLIKTRAALVESHAENSRLKREIETLEAKLPVPVRYL